MARGEEVFNDIVIRRGHLYVCGDVAMAADIRKTLEKIIEVFGEMSEADSKKHVINMRVNMSSSYLTFSFNCNS